MKRGPLLLVAATMALTACAAGRPGDPARLRLLKVDYWGFDRCPTRG